MPEPFPSLTRRNRLSDSAFRHAALDVAWHDMPDPMWHTPDALAGKIVADLRVKAGALRL